MQLSVFFFVYYLRFIYEEADPSCEGRHGEEGKEMWKPGIWQAPTSADCQYERTLRDSGSVRNSCELEACLPRCPSTFHIVAGEAGCREILPAMN